jgi:hypothetical protein
VRFGEPHQAQRNSATLWLISHAEGTTPSACGVFAYISRHFAYPVLRAEISGLAEIIWGANVTLWVTLAPRTSRGKTLALSPRDSKRVNNTVSTADRARYELRGIRLTIFVISIPHRVFTDREIDSRLPACRSSGEGRWGNSHGDVPCQRTNTPTTSRPNNAANASPFSSPSAYDDCGPVPRSRTARKIHQNYLRMALSFLVK